VRAALRGTQRLIPGSPVNKLEVDERPHPNRLAHRVLGREEIRRLLDACLPAYRPLIATALYTGMRQSELLGLTWSDVDIPDGMVHVRAQLSCARGGTPCQRVRLKTRSARRQIPLSPQLAAILHGHRETSRFSAAGDWVFTTRNGTSLRQRNVQRSALTRAAHAAGLNQDGEGLRFHDLRHPFASHLIIDLPSMSSRSAVSSDTRARLPRSISTRTSSTRRATPRTSVRA